jgi:hypothetical protein
MSDNPLLGSEGISRFLLALHPNSRPQGTNRFPNQNHWKDLSLRRDESDPRKWLGIMIANAIEAGCQDDIEAIDSFEITDGLAVFASMTWNSHQIVHLSVQCLVTSGLSLFEYIYGEECPTQYYRLDYSLEERGSLFNHPFPHIHTLVDGSPRLGIHCDPYIFPALPFLEKVFIEHFYDKWSAWLTKEHSKYFPDSSSSSSPSMGEYFEAYRSQEAWNQQVSTRRKIRELKLSSEMSLLNRSEGFPYIDPNCLQLNWH